MSKTIKRPFFARLKNLLGFAVMLTQKKAALAKLNSIALPKLYYSIGRSLVGQDHMPLELREYHEKILRLESQIAESSANVDEEANGRIAGKAKGLAKQAVRVTSNTAVAAQIHAAYMALGRAAVAAFGDRIVPAEFRPEFQQTRQRIDEINAEISDLGSAVHPSYSIRPGVIILAGLCTLVLVGVVVLWPTLQRVTKPQDTFGDPLIGSDEEAGGLVRVRIADDDGAGGHHPKKKMKSANGGGPDSLHLRMQMEKQLNEWQRDRKQLTAALSREPSLQHADDGVSSDAWKMLANDGDALLEVVSKVSWERLSSFIDEHTAEVNATSQTGLADSGEVLSAFSATLKTEKAKLAEARQKAIANILSFRETLASARKSAQMELDSLLKIEKDLWGRAAAAARAPLNSDSAVTPPVNQANLDEFNRSAALMQKNLEQLVAREEGNYLRYWSERHKDGSQGLRRVGSVALAQDLIEDQRKRSENALATSSAYLADGRRHSIESLKAFRTREQQEIAMEAREKELRGRNFQGSASMTDDELRSVLSNAPDITGLYLRKCTLLTDRSVPEIAKLRDLRVLELPSGSPGEESAITANGLRPLRNKKVAQLRLPKGIYDTKEGFEIFASMIGDPRNCCPCVGGHYGEWDMYDLSIGDDCLKPLKGLRGLTSLGTPKNVTDVGLATLAEIPDLNALFITLNREVTDKGLASLANCRGLKKLVLLDDRQSAYTESFSRINRSGSTVGAKGIQALRNLEFLFLPYHMRTEECFGAFIQALKEKEGNLGSTFNRNEGLLERIVLGDPESGPAAAGCWPCSKGAIKALAGKKGIRTLKIGCCECDDDSLLGVGRMPDLATFELNSLPRVTGAGLRGLGDAKELRTVSIINCENFCDEGLVCLGESATLANLTLHDLPSITDAGLTSLEDCKKLFRLHVARTGATAVSKVKLENALPKLNAYFE